MRLKAHVYATNEITIGPSGPEEDSDTRRLRVGREGRSLPQLLRATTFEDPQFDETNTDTFTSHYRLRIKNF